MLVLDNQLVLTTQGGERITFQLAEGRDRWLLALRGLVAARRGGAYR